MTVNVGSADRIIRFVVGALLIVLPFLLTGGFWDGSLAKYGLPVIGAVLVGTAFFRFCPMYRLVGIRTCKL